MTQKFSTCFILVFSKADEIENGAKTDYLNRLDDIEKRTVTPKVEAKLKYLCVQTEGHPNILTEYMEL